MDAELLGLKEAAELLGLSKSALRDRARHGGLPQPVVVLACGPIWTRAQLVEYARWRVRAFATESPGVVALAASGES